MYCGKFLTQSFMQHATRAHAIARLRGFYEGQTTKQNKDAKAQVKKLRRLEDALHSWHVFVPMIVESILASANGVLAGCTRLQKTEAVFFPLHVQEVTTWWSLVHLGFSQTMRQRVIDRVLGVQKLQAESAELQTVYVCRSCGLVKHDANAIYTHITELHLNPRLRESVHDQCLKLRPLRKLRKLSIVAPPHTSIPFPPPTGSDVGRDSLAAVAYRQNGARPPGLEVAVAYASFFSKLAQHVDFDGGASSTGALSQRDWGVAVRTFLPSRVRRQCHSYWKEYPIAIIQGTFRCKELHVPQGCKRASEAPCSSAGLPSRAGAPCSSAGCLLERGRSAQSVQKRCVPLLIGWLIY